jgi:hypothetical protein
MASGSKEARRSSISAAGAVARFSSWRAFPASTFLRLRPVRRRDRVRVASRRPAPLTNVRFESADLSTFDRDAEPGAFDYVTTFDAGARPGEAARAC